MINIADKTKERYRLIHALFYCCACLFILIEGGFFHLLSFYSVKPNLILLLITIYTFYFNFYISRVVLFCVFCGFLKDAMSSVAPGTHMLLFSSLGVVLCYLSKRFSRYNWIFIIPLFVVATVIRTAFYFVIQRIFFGTYTLSLSVMWRISIIELLYGLLIFVLFFKVIKRCVIDKLS